MLTSSIDDQGLLNWDWLKFSMLSTPILSAEKEAHFKVLRDFKIPDKEWLLLEKTLCSEGLS